MRSKDRLDQLLPGFEGSMRDLGSLATGRALCWALDDQRTEPHIGHGQYGGTHNPSFLNAFGEIYFFVHNA